MRILLGEADCDGAFGGVEMTLPAGDSGPPLHLDPTHAEAFYVLAGDLSLQVGDEVITGGPGTWACAPKYVPHTLANFGTGEGRVLCLFAPGGFEPGSSGCLPTNSEKRYLNCRGRSARPDYSVRPSRRRFSLRGRTIRSRADRPALARRHAAAVRADGPQMKNSHAQRATNLAPGSSATARGVLNGYC